MSNPVCPRCHREVPSAEAAFCAYCGTPIRRPKEISGEVQQKLSAIRKQEDPVKKHKLIEEAMAQHPDSLELAEEKLYLGRLYERSSRQMDFSVIKCYVWHVYLTPEEFSPEKRAEMRQEIVAHPDLLRCLELAEDRDLYMRRYLEKLSQAFISLFLKGSTRYNGSIFGIRLGGRMGKTLAAPAARALANIYRDQELESEQRDAMYEAFYRSFLAETGESQWVDELLSEKGLPIPVKL